MVDVLRIWCHLKLGVVLSNARCVLQGLVRAAWSKEWGSEGVPLH